MKIYDPVIDLKRYSRLMGEENFSREFSKTQIKEIIEHQITKFEIREKIVIIGKTDIGQIVLYESKKEIDIDKVFLEQLNKITSEDNKKFCLLNIKSEDSVIKDLSQFTIFVLEDGEKLELSDTLKKLYENIDSINENNFVDWSLYGI
jgi:hypothetical protein